MQHACFQNMWSSWCDNNDLPEVRMELLTSWPTTVPQVTHPGVMESQHYQMRPMKAPSVSPFPFLTRCHAP